jgi:predicted RND superfamily exporter protein
MASTSSHVFWGWVADFSARRARTILVISVALTLGFASFIPRIQTETDLDNFVRPAARELRDTIERDFDRGRRISIIFESRSDRSLLEPALLHKQFAILEHLKEQYEVTTDSLVESIDRGLKRVKRKSLLDYDDYSSIAEGMLALAGGRTIRDLEKISRHLVSHPENIAFYAKLRIASSVWPGVTGPGARETTYAVPYIKAIQAFIQLDVGYTLDERKRILTAIPDVIQAMGEPEMDVFALSDQMITYELDGRSQENVLALGVIVLLVNGLCIWLLFRSRRELLLVLVILGTAAIWSFGAASMLGLEFSFFNLVALSILFGTGIDDTFVFGRRFAEERAKEREFAVALRNTFQGAGNSIALTTFTTLVAFFVTGITATTEIVFDFCQFVALSMLVVFLLSTFLQGAIRSELDRWYELEARLAPQSPFELATRKVATVSRWATRHSRALLISGGILVIVAVIAATQLQSEMRRDFLISPGMLTYEANAAQEKYFPETEEGFMLVTGEIVNPELLKKLQLLQRALANRPEIEQVLRSANVESVVDLMAKLRIPISSDTPVQAVFDRISQNERTANYVLDRSFREEFERVVGKRGDRYDGLLMRFVTSGSGTPGVLAGVTAIEEELHALDFDEIAGIDIRIGGADVIYSLETLYYIEMLARSFLLTLLLNGAVLFLMWRRLLPTLLAMVPVVLAVTYVVGAMASLGVTLQLFTVAFGAIAVGLGLDYSIHIVERFMEERRDGQPPPQAAATALDTIGPHILASALTTIFGFGAAFVLALPLAVNFGLLTAASIALVYVVAMLFLPAALVRIGGRAEFGG